MGTLMTLADTFYTVVAVCSFQYLFRAFTNVGTL